MSANDPAIPDPQVVELVKQLEAEGFTSEHLEGAVNDAATERAAAVNNGGLLVQVRYLLRGGDNSFKPSDVLYVARKSAEESKTALAADLTPRGRWERVLVSGGRHVYNEAIRRAGEPCDILQSDETGEALWAVVLRDGFWMAALPTREQAEVFVQEMGWPLKSVIPDPEVDRREEARRG